MYQFNEPYTETDPNTIKNDMWSLAHSMQHEDLVCLVSTYFKSEQLAELIDDRMMGRV